MNEVNLDVILKIIHPFKVSSHGTEATNVKV